MNKYQRKIAITKLFDKYGKSCFYCGCDLNVSTVTIDHFIPISLGGSDDIRNLRPSCDLCNKDKSDKLINEVHLLGRNDVLTVFIERMIKHTMKYRRSRDEFAFNNTELSEQLHKQKIEAQRHKKVSHHYKELIKIILNKSGKKSLEELLTT